MATEKITGEVEVSAGPRVTNHNLFDVLRIISGYDDPMYARQMRISTFNALSAAEMRAVSDLEQIVNADIPEIPNEESRKYVARLVEKYVRNYVQVGDKNPESMALILRSAAAYLDRMPPAAQTDTMERATRLIETLPETVLRKEVLDGYSKEVREQVIASMAAIDMALSASLVSQRGVSIEGGNEALDAAKVAAGKNGFAGSLKQVVDMRALPPEFGNPITPRAQPLQAELPETISSGGKLGAPGQADTAAKTPPVTQRRV